MSAPAWSSWSEARRRRPASPAAPDLGASCAPKCSRGVLPVENPAHGKIDYPLSVFVAEIWRARHKRPDSLDAYDLYLRALPHVHANSPAETNEALRLLHLSLQLDVNYIAAHGYAA
jgi:hypothetical protein